MPILNITLLDYECLPKAGDYREFIFTFSVVDPSFMGSPDEQSQSSVLCLTVKISRSLQAIWNLDKVLFEYAKRKLVEKLSRGIILADATIDLNTSTVSSTCPFDPDTISLIPGSSNEVEVKRKLGFHTE
jgi:hypothetical protein